MIMASALLLMTCATNKVALFVLEDEIEWSVLNARFDTKHTVAAANKRSKEYQLKRVLQTS
ncbi:unnamed protein product, partial [Ceratitis capitata]